jgi:hypothetical protein
MIAAGLSNFHISDHCEVCYTVGIVFVKRQNQHGATIRANMKAGIFYRRQANRRLMKRQSDGSWKFALVGLEMIIARSAPA